MADQDGKMADVLRPKVTEWGLNPKKEENLPPLSAPHPGYAKAGKRITIGSVTVLAIIGSLAGIIHQSNDPDKKWAADGVWGGNSALLRDLKGQSPSLYAAIENITQALLADPTEEGRSTLHQDLQISLCLAALHYHPDPERNPKDVQHTRRALLQLAYSDYWERNDTKLLQLASDMNAQANGQDKGIMITTDDAMKPTGREIAKIIANGTNALGKIYEATMAGRVVDDIDYGQFQQLGATLKGLNLDGRGIEQVPYEAGQEAGLSVTKVRR